MTKLSIFPEPLPGYQTAVPFTYPKLPLQIAATLMFFVSFPLFVGLAWLLQGRLPSKLLAMHLPEILLMVATILVTVVVHEWVHGLAYWLLGYKVTFGANLLLFAAYAAAFGQWQKRNHNLIVALAPLVVLTPLLVGVLAVGGETAVFIALIALLFNTSGAVGDLYLTARLLRLPPTAYLYDVNPETMLIFMPQSQ